MAQADLLYEYLKERYGVNEPIFLSDLHPEGVKPVTIRQGMKKLTEDGRIARFGTGIYYIPGESHSKVSLTIEQVITLKYLTDESGSCGYVSGNTFARETGFSEQNPEAYEITTNKATTEYRETSIGDTRIIIRRPCVSVNEENKEVLQFLDMLKDVTELSDLRGRELGEKLQEYMKLKHISLEDLDPYLPSYPDRIYKYMYQAGLFMQQGT